MKSLPHALPDEALKELVHDADMNDERLWVPRGDDVWSLPLLFNVASGSWVNITRAKGDGVISRHRHPAAVTGYTLAGAWGYLEHDWTAKTGTFVFEPPGETHTLVVRPDPGHMAVVFHNFGPLIKVDQNGETPARNSHRCAKRGRGDVRSDKAHESKSAQAYSTVRRALLPSATP